MRTRPVCNPTTLFGLGVIFLLILGINHLFYNCNSIISDNYYTTKVDRNSQTTNAVAARDVSKQDAIFGGDAQQGTGSKDVKFVDMITPVLQAKLDATASLDTINTTALGCENHGLKFPCKNTDPKTCPRETPPQTTRERIEQIVLNEKLQVPPLMRDMSRHLLAQIPGNYKLVIVSALSSNHYQEGQAMLKSLHTQLLPRINNYTVIVYDIGLTQAEHDTYKKYCRCHLLKFPFDKLPAHFGQLGCFSWKPLMIRTHIDQADFLLWVDASIRFTYADKIDEFFKVTSERGVQQSRFPLGSMWIPGHTHWKMFEFLGESPCIYMPYEMVEAGFGMYHREPFVKLAILDPWLACVAQEACVCPMGYKQQPQWLMCPPIGRDHMKKLSLCHRTDQSALSIILAKVFGDKMYHFARPLTWFGSVSRDDKAPYFKELASKS